MIDKRDFKRKGLGHPVMYLLFEISLHFLCIHLKKPNGFWPYFFPFLFVTYKSMAWI